ncbi:AsmA family protein [Variovorax saccharolyticus]|uniref:AsmA family protein n=1 Tax=Variovorax saccharolyticus TaxID=3053516 RepID=UPI00257819F0|nr:AsmA family protein [Variovorax sp. J22R187]MDM0020693.1 AsmA family protein [Variovorax sp. J22R187]
MTTPASPWRRRSTKLLLWALGLLLVAALGLVVFLKTLDAGVYQRALERELSSVFDRQVSIGSVSFNVALRPTLSVRDLRIANPAWASRPDFVTAASGEARVDLVALWNGRVEMRAMRLDGVDLLLERNAEGEGNWPFGTPRQGSRRAVLPDFGTVSLSDVRIGWRPGSGAGEQVHLDSAEATISDAAPFRVQALADYRQTPMQLTVEADASLQAAIDGAPWRLSIGLRPKGASLALDVRLASIASLEGVELGIEATGEQLAAWSGVLGRTLPAWGPYRLSAHARYARGSLQVEDLGLSLDGLPMQPSRLEIGSGKAVFGASEDTRLTLAGKLGEAAFSLEASSAPWPELQKTDGSAPLTLRAELEGFTLSADGSITPAAEASDFDLALTARGDALAPMRLLAGLQTSHPLPVDLAARVTHSREGYAAKNIRGRVLGTAVSGDLAYAAAPRALLSGALNLGQLDLNQPDLKALESSARESRPREAAAAGAPAWHRQVEADLSLRIAGITGLPVPARNLSGRLRWRDEVLHLQGLAATLSGTDVTGEGTLRWRDERPQIDGKASIAVLDFARLGGSVARPGQRNALDEALPLAPLRAFDARLDVEVARIAGAPVPIAKLAALAQLRSGKLAIDLTSVTVANAPVQGQVTVDASGRVWRVDANAKADRIDLAALLRAPNRPDTVRGAIQGLQVVFGSQGTSVRELMRQAKLSARTAPFSLAVGRDRSPVQVQQASIEVEPGGPVRASAVGQALGAPMDLKMVAGPLAELLRPETAWPKIEATLRTALDGNTLDVLATSGPLQRLVGLRDVPLALQATLPGARATLDGKVGNLAAPTGTQLAARIEIDNLAQTATSFGASGLPALPVSASGRVTLGDGELAVDDLSAQAGKSDAAGRLRIRWRDRPNLSADLRSRLIDTTQWAEPTPNQTPVLDRPIRLPFLLSRDAQLQLRAERLLLHRYDLASLQVDGKLTNGLVQVTTTAAEGEMHGELRLDLRQQVPAAALRLSLKNVNPEALYTSRVESPSGAGTPPLLSINTQLAGAGTTVRNMLTAGRGEFLLTAGAGTLPMESSYGFERVAGNLLLALLPGRRATQHNELVCAAARFAIADGVATSSDGVALRLKHLDILGSGAVNLRTGEILFGYRAVRRELFQLSLMGLTSGVAKITGTISNPTVELDPSGALLVGTAAWATGGMSLLAGDLWRKLQSTANPCTRIAEGAQLSNDPLDVLMRSVPSVSLPSLLPARSAAR